MSREPIGKGELFDFLTTPKFKEWVEKIRVTEDKEKRRKLKSKLYCFTPSGLFSVRKREGLLKHSGYICIDIDRDDNPHIKDFKWLRTELGKINNVAYAGLSVSGIGVFALIPIKYPEKHKEHFEALKYDFESMGIMLDKSCGDVTRLRGVSYDPEAYINENAEVYTKFFVPKKHSSVPKPVYKTQYKESDKESTQTKVELLIGKIEKEGIDITGGYQQWFQIGCALANEFGEEGREMFHAVSQLSGAYDQVKTDIQFDGCLNNEYSYTIGTFFHYADENRRK